jgi:hypothetical protein
MGRDSIHRKLTRPMRTMNVRMPMPIVASHARCLTQRFIRGQTTTPSMMLSTAARRM